MQNVGATTAAIAARNHGVVGRAEAIAAGCGPRAVDRCLAAGTLLPILPGVYRHHATAETWLTRVRAAYIWAGEGAIVRARTAARLYGLEGFESAATELYVRSGKEHPSVLTKRIAKDVSVPTRWRKEMRTTTVERTLFDLCACMTPLAVGRAMDECLRKRLTTLEKLQTEVESGSLGRAGARTFRGLLAGRDDRDGKLRSEFERRMLAILRTIPSHRFEPNHEVIGRHGRYFLDFAVPCLRLGIECHSSQFHFGKEAAIADQARHRDLILAGWTILYYTWDDVVFRPEEVEAEIRLFLASSLPLGS